MRNRDMPASGIPEVAVPLSGDAFRVVMNGEAGLTKREAAAIAAMQGMMRMETSESDPGKLAEFAVRQADALFDELDKGADDA